MIILFLSIVNIFVYSVMYEALIGILLGCLYVIVDTQIIIAKASSGVFEPFVDACNLFVDLFKIFIEILKMFSEKEEKKKNKK